MPQSDAAEQMTIADEAVQAGVAAHQRGAFDEAEQYYRRAIVLRSNHAEALNNLGVLLEDTHRHNEAEACYRQSLIAHPTNVDAHNNLGLLLRATGRLDEAESCFRRAQAIAPNLAQTCNNLGLVLGDLHRYEEAEKSFRQAISLQPGYAHAHNNLGLLLQEMERIDEAEACFRTALGLRPAYSRGWNNLGLLFYKSQRMADAEACFRKAIELEPAYADPWNNLGVVLHKAKHDEDAEACYRQAIAHRPDYADAHHNLGALLHGEQRMAEAETCYLKALELEPDSARSHDAYGRLLQDMRRMPEAERHFRQALAIDPARPPTLFNLSLSLLAQGQYEEGWRLYEARFMSSPLWGDEESHHVRPRLPFPEWQGEPLAGRSLVVWPEQGHGDSLQFVRYLPLLKARGVRHLTLVCPPALENLFSAINGVDTCIPLTRVHTLPPHDYACLLLSLPWLFGTTLDTVPAHMPYLRAPADRAAEWRKRLPREGLKVGLVWAGAPRPDQDNAHVIDQRRSLHAKTYLPLLQIPGIRFISLQKGDTTQPQLLELPSELRPFDPMAEVTDFADTAAIIENLDLVISVDTSVAHLAGALGKPVWILCRFDTCWRWLIDRDDSPWYPTARLFTQTRYGEWNDVIARVAQALKAFT